MPAANKCCWPFSRATLLVLVWSALLNGFHTFSTNLTPLLPIPNKVQTGIFLVNIAMPLVVMLVAGVLGDTRIGRYRVITAGTLVSTVAVLAILSAFVMLQFNCTLVAGIVLMYIALPVCMAGMGSSLVCVLPFIIDQMIGASAEDIGAAVQWCYWGAAVVNITLELILCLPVVIVGPQLKNTLAMVFLAVITFSLATILTTDCLWHKLLEVQFKRTNPLTTFFRVLNYARKTKYPKFRSAFTYIDEEEPSRLDYAKHKFGGPFTEEKVEDVKTILTNLPLFLFIFLSNIMDAGLVSRFHTHVIPTNTQTFKCVDLTPSIVDNIVATFLIPAYRFILYPLLRTKLPNFLKRVGAGAFIWLISTLVNLGLDTVGHLHSNTTSCMFDTQPPGSANTLPVPIYWLLIPDILHGTGNVMVYCTGLELLLAQTPLFLRGTAIGMALTVLIVGALIHEGVVMILSNFDMSKATPSCGFYYYLVLSILVILSLVLFTIAAKRYKLRERERHVNIQAIAEEHYERYFDQEDKYMREAANMYKHAWQHHRH